MKKILFTLVLMHCFTLISFAMDNVVRSRDEVVSAYIYLLSKNTHWPNEEKIQKFTIMILEDNNKIATILRDLTEGLTLKKRAIKIVDTDSVEAADFSDVQVVFVSNSFKEKLKEVFVHLKNKPILLISESAPNMRYSMINLYENMRYRINIEINLDNIVRHKLKVNDKIILTGGSRIGVSKLYKSSIETIKEQEKKFGKYQALNEKLKIKLQEQNKKIALLQKDIDAKKNEYENTIALIKKKERVIALKEKDIAKKEKKLIELQKNYKAVNEKFKNQQLSLQKKIDEIQKAKENIKKYTIILEQKLQKIKHLDKKIKEQKEKIEESQEIRQKQAMLIQKQKLVLFLLIIIAVLLLLFAVYFYFNKNTLVKLNKELHLAKDEAEYANRSKSVFLANMSHELRTPLNAILGFSELLIEDEKLPAAYKKTINVIYNSGTFLLTLINDILDIARIESGKTIIEKSPVNMKYIIEDVVDLLKSRAEAKSLKLRVVYLSEIEECIQMDVKKIRQILINHVTNAIKYSESGEIVIKLEMKQGKLKLIITDQGSGIAKKDLENIFEPFEQVGNASSDTGSGLGLTISKQFVEAMGGEISVESELGKGSTFTIVLPYTQCKKNEHVIKEDLTIVKKVIGITPKSPKLKVMIVEDKENNILLLQRVLSVLHFDIKVARNGEEAVALFKSYKPDLIWMDRRMPKMNGEKATQIIRSLPGGKDVIIIALTASATKEDKKRLEEVGVDDYTVKPYKFYEIYDLIAKYFDVEYIYQNEETSSKNQQKEEYSFELLKEEIEKLDESILQELYNSAILLNRDDMKAVLEKLKTEHETLYSILLNVIEDLNYGDILKAIEEIKEEKGLN